MIEIRGSSSLGACATGRRSLRTETSDLPEGGEYSLFGKEVSGEPSVLFHLTIPSASGFAKASPDKSRWADMAMRFQRINLRACFQGLG
jgi:hypothetical protein